MKLYEVIVLETCRVKYYVEATDEKTAREKYYDGQQEESMPESSSVQKVKMIEDLGEEDDE